MPTVNVILWLARGGQVAGSQLLRDLLEQNGFSTRLVITGQELPSESRRADVNIFSSEISPLWLPMAKCNILIPNQEQDLRQSFGRMHADHFSETPEQLCYLRLLDKLLVKTHHAHDIYRRLGLDASYVGFTCRDRFLPGISKAFDPWLCVIGDSFVNKDVRPVLRVWERNPQFPRLLVCLHQVPPKLEPALKPLPNVVYRRERLGDDELRELQNRCAIHLCPSTMEGWGHAIVESMSAGAMLLTLNAPPMDEHVNETRGASFRYASRKRHAFGFQYTIDEASLEQTVRRVMALPGSELKDRGRRAREYFLRNDEQFRAALVRELRRVTGGTNFSQADGPIRIDGSVRSESANAADAMGDVPLAAAPVSPRPASAAVVVEVSAGEMLDKISILRIKRLRLEERSALANVERELASLEAARDRQLPLSAELESLAAELEAVNAALWQTEDDLRICEQKRDFGPVFIGLARSVYRLNDRRTALKRRVNAATGSLFIEEKLHPDPCFNRERSTNPSGCS